MLSAFTEFDTCVNMMEYTIIHNLMPNTSRGKSKPPSTVTVGPDRENYVMCSKERRERKEGGVIVYIKQYIQAYDITLKSEADFEEAILCNTVTSNSTLKIGVIYRSPNIRQEEDVK